MAENSIREQLLVGLKTSLESLDSIKTVIRNQPSTIEELKSYAATQLPLIAMVGGVPVPVEHRTTTEKGNKVDVFTSVLQVMFYFYFMNRVDADSQLSSLLDDFWVLIYSDQTRGDLALSTDLEPKVEVAVWDPYVAFSVVGKIAYIHEIGGI
jgi:hypothetical protein